MSPDHEKTAFTTSGKLDVKILDEIVGRLRAWKGDVLRLLVMPDHPTPIAAQTHTDTPVPFLLWGPGFSGNGAERFTEAEAAKTDFFLEEAYNIIGRLTGK